MELTNDQKQVLRNQVITRDQPGPVLRDFGVLLEFLGPDGVEAGGKYHLLPIRIIDELDGQLSRPLHLELKRPQIRSHPYIQGLNLLLRASGLGRVQKSGAKTRLILDQGMIDQWDRLNPTEQYFQLLEAWLRIGRAEMVGERGSFWGDLLGDCLRGWNVLPKKGVRLNLEKPTSAYVPGFYGNLYVLALMDLFGLMDIEQASQPVTPWRPARIKPTPFGDALLDLLQGSHFDLIFNDEPPEEADEDKEEPRVRVPKFGAWQASFQPYFPEWRENLEFPQRPFRKGEFTFRVSLGKIWRRIAVPAEATLADLMALTLRSMKFGGDHLYEFRYRDQWGAEVTANHPMTDEGPWADEIAIGTLPIEPGQEMQLTYDFGDNWRFAIKLEQIDESMTKPKKPRIAESHGEAPAQYPNWDD